MWYSIILRFIRRRIVLGIIFLFSLTYCLVNLLGKGGPLSLESEEFIVQREHPMVWRTLQEHNRTNDLTLTCRNSIQGKVLIVDDRGFVCQRSDLLWTGCCNLESSATLHYSCETCNNENCCAIYEYCVSCCLHPDKRNLLERVLSNASGRQSAVFASVKDHFELCLVKCRTNSHSVQHENKYRDPKNKHCYGETFAYDSQKDSMTGKGGSNAVGDGGGGGSHSIP